MVTKKLTYPPLFREKLPGGLVGRVARLEDMVVRRIFKAARCLEASQRKGTLDYDPYMELLREVRESHDRYYVSLRDFEARFPHWPMILTADIVLDIFKIDVWDALKPGSEAQQTLAGIYKYAWDDARIHGRLTRLDPEERPAFGLVFPIAGKTKYILHNDRLIPRSNTMMFKGLVLETFDNYLEQVSEKWLYLLAPDEDLYDDYDPFETEIEEVS